MTSSEARSGTFHHYPLRSLPTYYADESDEGLVTCLSIVLVSVVRLLSLQDSMSSADTALSHVRVPYDSDDQDGNNSPFDRKLVDFRSPSSLAYRQQLRERSQPSQLVEKWNFLSLSSCPSIDSFFSLIHGIDSLLPDKDLCKSTPLKQPVFTSAKQPLFKTQDHDTKKCFVFLLIFFLKKKANVHPTPPNLSTLLFLIIHRCMFVLFVLSFFYSMHRSTDYFSFFSFVDSSKWKRLQKNSTRSSLFLSSTKLFHSISIQRIIKRLAREAEFNAFKCK